MASLVDLLSANARDDKDALLYRHQVHQALRLLYECGDDPPGLSALVEVLGATADPRAQTLAQVLALTVEGPHGAFFEPVEDHGAERPTLTVFDLFGVLALPRPPRTPSSTRSPATRPRSRSRRGSRGRASYSRTRSVSSCATPPSRPCWASSSPPARKWRTGVWAITQAWAPVVTGAPATAQIIEVNAGSQILLSPGAAGREVEALSTTWGLAPHEAERLAQLTTIKGRYSEFLLRTTLPDGAPYSGVLRYEPTEYERILFSSDPADRRRLDSWRHKNPDASVDTLIAAMTEHEAPT